MTSPTVNDEAGGAGALGVGTSGESRGASDPGEEPVPSAARARNGIAARALPEMTAELFVEAAEALAGTAEPRLAEALLRGAEAQEALLRWAEAK